MAQIITNTKETPLDFNAPYNESSFPGKIQPVGNSLKNWNKQLPYSFSIREAGPTGIVGDFAPTTGSVGKFSPGIDLIVRLRIPPQNISVSSAFATSVIATNSGVLEEHNGLVFRNIVIRGTTGLAPSRSVTFSAPSPLEKIANLLFPNVVQSINSIVKKAKTFAT